MESEKPARRKSGGLFCIYRLSSPEAIRLNSMIIGICLGIRDTVAD
ncbi:hypothetical protein EDWATA_03249 [Edwardsiella tarda ATCC 23685]|uniref:Uncharacterized protein n=1 Tax=Edwardsiella tarda ATCC 23685 TaxID=500638 RepID=D4F8Z4_EDWTA|nr:hypothetical protein EDWATA_03249 [Edwardsiella tarda ATCC 23685]